MKQRKIYISSSVKFLFFHIFHILEEVCNAISILVRLNFIIEQNLLISRNL